MVGQARPRQATSPGQDLLEPWADQIYQWITNDRLQMTRIRELRSARGCVVSYPSLRRFIINRNWRRRSKTTVRMADTPPGEVVEADFGRLGMITDPATGQRKAIWPMQHQKLPDVIAGLEAAWAFFGGMPKYLVIDNFPPRRGGGYRPAESHSHQGLSGVCPAPGHGASGPHRGHRRFRVRKPWPAVRAIPRATAGGGLDLKQRPRETCGPAS